MPTKEINILRDLIARLDQKPFDLQSWKTNAMMALGRIFGESTHKVVLIRNIQPDYSSWSLRDATGRMSQLDECRKVAREILEATITELEIFGLPNPDDSSKNHALSALEEHITVKQARDLAQIMAADIPNNEKASKMTNILNGLDQVDLLAIVVKMLIN